MTYIGRSAQVLVQEKIDITQWLDDIEYGLRSVKACGGERYCTGVHAAQLYRASAAAAIVLDSTAENVFHSSTYHNGIRNTAGKLREARDIFRECLRETKAELKAIGGVKQLRLALESGGHDYALAA